MSDQDMNLGINITGSADSAVQATTASSASLDKLSAAIEEIAAKFGIFSSTSAQAESGVKNVGTAANEAKGHIDNVGASAQRASESIRNMGALGGFFQDFTEHSRSMAMAADAMGLSVGAAVSRMSAFGVLVDGLGDAAPAIVGLSAAVVGLFGAFELGKDAIGSASALQDQMAKLGMAIKDTGGNVGVLTMQTREFAEQQASSTTNSVEKVLGVMTRLISTGHSVADSMTITRVAEDAAASTGRSLEEITNGLIEAQNGRTNGLLSLGIVTREQIKDGLTFNEVLGLIEQHMGGAAATAAGTFSGSLDRLHNAWDTLMANAGTPFIDLLTRVVNQATQTATTLDSRLQPAFKALSSWASAEAPVVLEFFGNLASSGQKAASEFSSEFGPAVDKVKDGVGSLHAQINPELTGALELLDKGLLDGKTGWDGFNLAIARTEGTIAAVIKGIGEVVQAASDMYGVLKHLTPWGAMEDAWNNLPGKGAPTATKRPPGLQFQLPGPDATFTVPSAPPGTHVGNGYTALTLGQGGGSGFTPQASTYETYQPHIDAQATQINTNVTNQLTAAKMAASSIEDQLTLKMKLSTTATQEQAAALELNSQKMADTQKQIGILSTGLEKEITTRNSDAATLKSSTAAYDNAKEALDKYEQSATGAQKQSSAWKVGEAQLQGALADSKAKMDDAQKAVNALNEAIKNHKVTLAELQNVYRDLQNDPAVTAAGLTRDWNTFIQTTDRSYQDDLATFNMTASQKAAFWASKVTEMLSTSAHWSKEDEQYAQTTYRNETQSLEDALKQQKQAQDQFVTDSSQKLDEFLDTFVSRNKSMAEELRSVYQDIEKWFVQMLADMLARALATMPFIQSLFGFGGGGLILGSSGVGGLAGATLDQTTSGGVAGGNAIVGGGGSGSAALASLASSPVIASAMSSAMSPSGGGGSVGSGSYGGSSSGGGSASPDFGMNGVTLPSGSASPSPSGGAAGVGATGYQPYGGVTSGGGVTGLLGLLGKSGIGGLALGAMGGGVLGGALFGGKGDAAIGGAAGVAGIIGLQALLGSGGLAGALPMLLSSPLGWGLLAGSLLLGAFAGSLFGDHFSQADEPDIYQNQAWGQANADMMGSTTGNPMSANGKQFIMDSATIQATNGQGWNLTMENFVAKFRSNVSQLPPSLQEAFPKIEQLWGGATNQKQFNPDGKDGFLDIGSGQRALWSDFWGVIQTYGQSISGLMQEYAPIDTYAASINGTVSQIGSSSMGGSGGFGSPFAMGSPGGGSNSNAIAAGGPGRQAGGGVSPIINVHLGRNMSTPLIPEAQMTSAIKAAVTSALGDDMMRSLQ